MFSRIFFVLFVLKLIIGLSALVELPQIEENNILKTDHFISETLDQISVIRVNVNERPTLKQYLFIYKHLAASLYDYNNLIEVAKLSRVDKTKINNQTQHFMAILNGILEEDVKHGQEAEFVIKHIDGFLKNLDEYTQGYKYDKYDIDIIIADLLDNLPQNETFHEKQLESTLFIETKRSQLSMKDDSGEYWVPSGRRVYQGKHTTIKQFPFMVSILIFNHFQCAGSIIKDDIIITAASCLQLAWNNRFFRENPTFLSVRVGSTFSNLGGEIIPVLEIYFHPEYEPKTLRNNICLLRLYRILNLSKRNKKVKKIEFDRNAHPLPSNTDGITIIGWGARERHNFLKDPYLSFAVLDFYSIAECQDVYSPNYVTRFHFCGGFLSRGGGACNRDIGGPGIAHGVLAGVISFGSPTCGTANAPTVFTKVGFYAKWIEAIMAQEIPNVKRKTTLMDLTTDVFTSPFVTEKSTFIMRPFVTTDKPTIPKENIMRILKEKNMLRRFLRALMNNARLKNWLLTSKSPKTEEKVVALTPNAMILEPPGLIDTQSELNKANLESTGDEFEDFYEDENQNQGVDIEHDIVKLIDDIKKSTNKENGVLNNVNPLYENELNRIYRKRKEFTPLLNSTNTLPIPIDQGDTDIYYSNENKDGDDSGLDIDFKYGRDQVSQTTDNIISNHGIFDIVSEHFKDEIENMK